MKKMIGRVSFQNNFLFGPGSEPGSECKINDGLMIENTPEKITSKLTNLP